MAKKYERGSHNPSWVEVILGAVLSAVLGVILGVALLVLRPVSVVKDLPKAEERTRGTVYYVEGATGGNARAADAKRKQFVAGQSVTVTEAELNALASAAAGPAPGPTAPKAGEKKDDKKGADKKGAEKKDDAGPPPEGFITAGTPNFRIRGGVLQVGAPVTISYFGVGQKVTMQARGGFKKDGDVFVYDPSELYLGSLPLQRLPFAASFIRSKVFDASKVPEDIATAWRKLSSVTIEDNALKLVQ